MGEIAEMMLDGTMCQGCGEFLHDGEDGDGFPGYCAGCAPKEPAPAPRLNAGLACPHPKCSRRLKRFADERNLYQHMTMAHQLMPEQFAATKKVP